MGTLYAQPGYAQPGYAQPGHAQPDVQDPVVGAQDDARMQQNLQELFASFPGLNQVEVEVINGTILLRGEVNTLAAHDQALVLAELARGASGVADDIVVQADIIVRLSLLLIGFVLAVGFAIRDSVENFLASILLSIRQPFAPRDHIVIEGNEGKVVKLTSRETVLMTLDGNHIRIPNATVYKGVILNYTRNPLRRLSFEVGIDTGVDIRAATSLAIETMGATPGVVADPPTKCLVKALGDSNVVLQMHAWTDQKLFDYYKVRSETIKNVKEAFDAASYDMPEPIYRLKIQGSGSQAALVSTADTILSSPARAPGPGTSPNQSPDVSAETYLDEQISKDKATDSEEDLLQK